MSRVEKLYRRLEELEDEYRRLMARTRPGRPAAILTARGEPTHAR